MNHVLSYLDENKKKLSFNGYAFINEWNKCFIIVYGEGRRDLLSKHLATIEWYEDKSDYQLLCEEYKSGLLLNKYF